MKKILIISDSLALPREKPEICIYEKTWPFLLREKFTLHQVSVGGATSTLLAEQVSYHKLFNPDITIIQSGIVDCTPRSLSRLEIDLITKFSLTRKYLMPYVQKRKVAMRKRRNISYTTETEYKKNLEFIRSAFGHTLAIGIVPAATGYENKVPGIKKKVNDYNHIQEIIFKENFVSLADMPATGVMSDFVHLNEEGHRYVYGKILEKIG